MLLAQPNAGRNSLTPGANGGVDFSSFKGPGDDALPQNEINGYSLVSRIGEVVINSFIDINEWGTVKETVKSSDVTMVPGGPTNDVFEVRPPFAEWASTLPGMICVARKARTDVWRRHMATESAIPVISCAVGLGAYDQHEWFFAGICRSKSVVPPDDGRGPQIDEYFTLSIGGMATLLNTSGERLCAGDQVAWSFTPLTGGSAGHPAKRARLGPRRVGLKKVSSSFDPCIVGRVLSFSKPGEPVDVLIKQ